MLFIDFKDVVALLLSVFLLAVCGFILVVDRVAQAERKRRKQRRKEE